MKKLKKFQIFLSYEHILLEKGGNDMQNPYWLYFVALLAGFALILLPSNGGAFSELYTTYSVVGTVIVLLFALVLLWKALHSLFKG